MLFVNYFIQLLKQIILNRLRSDANNWEGIMHYLLLIRSDFPTILCIEMNVISRGIVDILLLDEIESNQHLYLKKKDYEKI